MFEVYSEVRAVLSPRAVGAIGGCVAEAVRRVVATARVEQEGGRLQLCGTLDGILIAKSRLEELLAGLQARRPEASPERDSTTLSEEGDTSYDRERETNASSNGHAPPRPLSKRLRLVLRERPRRLALQLRALKKRAADDLSEDLRHMKLATEDSDTGTETPRGGPPGKEAAPYKHFCTLCSFRTKRGSHFSKHMAIHEKVSTVHKCGECPFTSVRLSHLRRHEMSHSATVHPCPECRYKTDDLKFLLRHVRLKHRGFQADKGAPSHVLSCPHCSYQTTRQHYFERHQRMHGSKRGLLHQCPQCRYKTHRKEHFVRHVDSVHGDRRPFLCHLCGKAFKRGDALAQHSLTHPGIGGGPGAVGAGVGGGRHRCGECGKGFRSQAHLCEHGAVHSEVRAFLCEVCGASFKTRSVHRKHVLSIHRNPRAYACDACAKRFNTPYALKRHRKLHPASPAATPPGPPASEPPTTTTTTTTNNGSGDTPPFP